MAASNLRAETLQRLESMARQNKLNPDELLARLLDEATSAPVPDKTEQRMLDLLETTSVAIIVVNQQGRIIRANRQTEALFGYPPGDLLNQSIDLLVPEDVRGHHAGLRQGYVESPHNRPMGANLEITARRQDGTEFPAEISLNYAGSGDEMWVLCFVNDITERKEAELNLLEQQEILGMFIKHNPAAVAMFDTEIRYLAASRRWITDYRLDTEDLIGRSHYEIFPEIGDDWKAIHQRCLGGAVDINEQAPFPRADGSMDWLRWDVRPWYKITGEVGGIIMSTEVITERVEAAQKLAASEARFRSLASNVPVGIFRSIPSGRVTYANSILCEIFELSQAQVLDDGWQDRIHPKDREHLLATREQTILKGRPLDIEYRIMMDDGRVKWLQVHTAPVADEQGNFIEYVGSVTDITERVEATQKLVASEERFRALTMDAPVGIFRASKDGQMIFANSALLEIYELGDAAIKANWQKYIHPEDRQKLMKARQETNLKGKPLDTEYRVMTDDGRVKWLHLRTMPLFNAQGEFHEYIGSVIDVTANVEATQKLAASEAQFRALTMDAPVGIFRSSSSGQLEFANKTLGEIYELSDEAIAGEGWQQRVHPEDREHLMLIRQGTILQGEAMDVEHRLLLDDGRVKWVHVHTVPIHNTQGDFTGYVGSIVDTTTTKQAEQITVDFQNKLKALQRIGIALAVEPTLDRVYRRAVEWARLELGYDRAGLFLTDETGKALIGTFGTDPDGHTRAEYDIHSTIDAEPWMEEVNRSTIRARLWQDVPLYDYDEVIGQGWRAAAAIRSTRHDIGYLVVDNLLSGRPPRSYEFELLSLYGASVGQLIELKQRQNELAEAQKAADAANRSKSAFLANMSHELRTPLNAIIGYSQLLEMQNALSGEQHKQIEIIHKSGEHLLELINDILDLSRIEAGQLELHITAINLHNVLHDVHTLLNVRAKSRNLLLMLDYKPDLPVFVRVDEAKLRQVLINLVNNALKFTEEGGVAIRVSHDRNYLYFEVEDTGAGIDAGLMPRLFQPFTRDLAHSSIEGTGLGLTICRQFVHKMGGEISLSSEVGTGTLARFHVKYEESSQADATQEIIPVRRVRGLAAGTTPPRILVVEDRDENRNLLVNLLRSTGFEVQEAINGEDAIVLNDEWQPDLILMDMRMPGMGGDEATRRIIAAQGDDAPVIIAVTASAFSHQRESIMESGCRDVVVKPYRFPVIFSMIAQYLDVHYVYDDEGENGVDSNEEAVTLTSEELSAQVAALSVELRKELGAAAVLLDRHATSTVIDRIAETNTALANHLRDLAAGFRFDQISQLLEAE